jgi:ketosteroid isomerase-like protein
MSSILSAVPTVEEGAHMPSNAWEPEALKAAPYRYFELCDKKDLENVMSQYAPDASETVMPGGDSFVGASAIRRMYENLFADFESMRHEVTRVVVDASRGRVATEQHFRGSRPNGEVEEMYNCNFFDYDAQGKLSRVYIWMSSDSPLRDS